MPRYRFGNCTLSCDFAINNLPLATGGYTPRELVHVAMQPGGDTARPGDEASRFISLAGQCDFIVGGRGLEVRVCPAPGTHAATISRLFLDHAMPRVLDLRGSLVLHAGAVDVGSGAVAFLGVSGAGKSTLTGYLHGRGHGLLTDDALVVEASATVATITPTYRSMRLRPDSYSALHGATTTSRPATDGWGKLTPTPLGETSVAAASRPVAAICILGAQVAPAVSLTELAPADACMAIVANAFQFDNLDPERARQRLQQAARLCRYTPVYRLDYPREFAALDQIREVLLGRLETGAGKLPASSAALQ